MMKLWRDRRGNALVIAGAALPFLVGAAGLATDTIQWAMWKRELQRAADSAAYAGVYAKVQDNAAMTAAQAVNLELETEKNNSTWQASELLGAPVISYPTGTGFKHGVQVTLQIKRRLGFSSLFMSEPPTITATGAAALFESDKFCVVALAPSGSALIIAGSADVTLGCGAISNSEDPIEAVGVNGAAHNFAADPVAAVGGIEGNINGSPNLEEYHVAMEDPYSGVSTDIPPSEECRNFNHPSKTNKDGSKVPGCYNSFNLSGGTVTLSPGTYYLNNTDIKLTGHERLVGEGVTIILTGDKPGSIDMSGNSSMDLTAQTTGEYANLLLIQSPDAATGNDNTINGDNYTALDGAMYFPKGDLKFSGSSGQAFQCAMVVGYTVEFTGSAIVQNNTSACDADTQVSGWKVRLIA